MVVGAAADHAEAGAGELRREGAGVVDDLLLVGRELRLGRLSEAHRLGGDDVHERPALHAREQSAVDVLGVRLAAQDEPGPWPAQRLVRGGGHEVGVRHRARMEPGGDQAGDVRHVHHEERAAAPGNLAHAREVDDARVGAGAGDEQLR